MKFLKRISTFLRKSIAIQEGIGGCFGMQHRSELLGTAAGLAEWALEFTGFSDACNRADILGNFLLHYDDHDEVKEAIRDYVEDICQRKQVPRWMKSDIIFNLSQHFNEPDIDWTYEDMLDLYGYSESDCAAAERYYNATAEERVDLRGNLDEGILKLLERHDRKKQYYLDNAKYISELHQLVKSIEFYKYEIL